MDSILIKDISRLIFYNNIITYNTNKSSKLTRNFNSLNNQIFNIKVKVSSIIKHRFN